MNKPKILIADDGESQRYLLKGFLLREGYLVDEAENGIKALQCVKDQHFDIILLDHKMPGMNGVEVLKEVKRTNPEIAVVIISAYGTIERAVEAMEAGAFYYITKPVELDKLLIILDHISQRHLLVNSQRRALHQRLGDMNEGIDAMNDQKEDNKTFLYSMLSRIFSAQSDGFIVGMNDRTIC